MLKLFLPAIDDIPAVELCFEHSLASLSKWEAIYKKPFFTKNDKTEDEFRSYVAQMVLTPDPPEYFENRFGRDHFALVRDYINDPHTATTFREEANAAKSHEVITAEIIYYWMVMFRIDWEAQHWHLNQLMTLIRVCGVKQAKPKKMTKTQQMAEYRRLNDERRQQLGTSG